MEIADNGLIQELVKKHKRRMWWKNPIILLGMWFAFHLVNFVSLGQIKADLLVARSSPVYFIFISFGILLSGGFFIQIIRHVDLKVSNFKLWISALALWMGLAIFIESQIMGTLLHTRSAGLTNSDFSCFWHSVLLASAPALVFPVIFKQFFVMNTKWAITFMSIHLALLGSLLNELKCPDRELWHSLLGHQTTFFGVAFLLILVTYFERKLTFLKASRPYEWRL